MAFKNSCLLNILNPRCVYIQALAIIELFCQNQLKNIQYNLIACVYLFYLSYFTSLHLCNKFINSCSRLTYE